MTRVLRPVHSRKTGHSGAWESYTLGAANQTVNAVYTPNTYTVTFRAGDTVLTRTYKYGDTSLADEPAVPERPGYTGRWSAYSLYPAGDIDVTAIYTPITYTARFMADGVLVKAVPFTVEDTSIAAPPVPEKVGSRTLGSLYHRSSGHNDKRYL